MITEVTGALALVLIPDEKKIVPSGLNVTLTNVTVKIFQIWDPSRIFTAVLK